MSIYKILPPPVYSLYRVTNKFLGQLTFTAISESDAIRQYARAVGYSVSEIERHTKAQKIFTITKGAKK